MAKLALATAFSVFFLLIAWGNGAHLTANCGFYCFLQPRPNQHLDVSVYKKLACTHMVYGFATLTNNFGLETPSSFDLPDAAFIGNFENLQLLKQTSQSPKKLILGIHISSNLGFLSNAATRRIVAKNTVQMAKSNHLDGLFWHLDAESIWNVNLGKFFKTLKDVISSEDAELQVVLALGSRRIARAMHVLDELEPHLDTVYLIGSNVPSSEDPTMAIAVDPLFGSEHVPVEDSISDNAELLAKHGFPRRKIVVGLTAWAFSFRMKSKFDLTHHGSPINGPGAPGPLTRRKDGRLAFHELCKLAGESWLHTDDTAQVTSFKVDDTWFSITQPGDQLKTKLDWIGENGFGGVGLASLAADDQKDVCGQGVFPLHTFVGHHFQCRAKRAKKGTDSCTRLCTWRPTNDSMLNFENLASNWCSHLALSTLEIDSLTGNVTRNEYIAETVKNYNSWKAKEKPYLLISVGDGQTNDVWRMALSVPFRRTALVVSLRNTLHNLDADGLIISWTEPGPENGLDTTFLDLFIAELRQMLSDSILILKTSKQSAVAKKYNVKELSRHLNYILVEAYRFHNPKSFFTGHHSPLFMGDNLIDPKNSIEGLTNDWISQGASRSQLIIEFSAEAMLMYFGGHRESDRQIGSPASMIHNNLRSKPSGLVSQTDVCEAMKGNNTRIDRMDQIGVPCLVVGAEFYAYDDEQSMQIKAVWTSLNNFGGLALYALDADNADGECPADRPFPLLRSLVRAQVCDRCLNKDEITAIANDSPSSCRPNFQVSCGYRIPFPDDKSPLYPDDLPFNKCTEIVVEEAELLADGTIHYNQPNAIDVVKDLFNATKTAGRNTSIVLSLRCGMNGTEFETLMESLPYLEQMLYNHVKTYHYDGIELRCDNVLKPATKKAFTEFLSNMIRRFKDETKREKGRCKRTLSIRVPAWNTKLSDLYGIDVLNNLQHVVLEPFQASMGSMQLISPLFGHGKGNKSHQAIDSTINMWLSDGLHRQVILIHIPTYAIVKRQTRARSDFLTNAFKGQPFKLIAQKTLCQKLQAPETRRRMQYDSVAAFATSAKDEWLSFETPETVTYKTKYALRERLGGIGFMALNEEDFADSCKQGAYPLLDSVSKNECIVNV